MKKRLGLVLISAMLTLSTFQCSNVLAATDIAVRVNGTYVNFESSPEIIDDKLYAPAKELANAIGIPYSWNNDTKTATASNEMHRIEIYVSDSGVTGKDYFLADSRLHPTNITTDFAKIIDGKLYVLEKAFVKEFGASATYDNSTRIVDITAASASKNNLGVSEAKQMLGSWKAFKISGDDEHLYDFYKRSYIKLENDYTGTFEISNYTYNFKWEHADSENSIYHLTLDNGTEAALFYYPANGYLVFVLDNYTLYYKKS